MLCIASRSAKPGKVKKIADNVMMLRVLGAVAEFERGIIRERCIAGQTAAMMRGIKCGRPRSISADDEKEIVRLWKSNRYTMDSLAAIFQRASVECEALNLQSNEAGAFELAFRPLA